MAIREITNNKNNEQPPNKKQKNIKIQNFTDIEKIRKNN